MNIRSGLRKSQMIFFAKKYDPNCFYTTWGKKQGYHFLYFDLMIEVKYC